MTGEAAEARVIHSLKERTDPTPCDVATGHAHPRLRPYVVGYSGFWAPAGPSVRRRLLPLSLTTLIFDISSPQSGVVTGPRAGSVVEQTEWSYGVSVGLTPAGVEALLGMRCKELIDARTPLTDLLGDRAVQLTSILAEAPDWPTRFALLDEHLSAWIARDEPHSPITRAWRLLHVTSSRLPIGQLAAELGVSRRYLELGFQRTIGLTPKTVARIARFQRALTALATPTATLQSAVACGFADQPHLNREARALTGLAPTELFASVQDKTRSADYVRRPWHSMERPRL